MPGKWKLRPQQPRRPLDEGKTISLQQLSRAFASIVLLQLRLEIEQIQLTRRSDQMHEDHALRCRRKVNAAFGRSPSSQSDARPPKTADSGRAIPQKMSPGRLLKRRIYQPILRVAHIRSQRGLFRRKQTAGIRKTQSRIRAKSTIHMRDIQAPNLFEKKFNSRLPSRGNRSWCPSVA